MASPFPGMDPYLEQPVLWASFHSKFVVALADAIESQLDAAYYVEVETRSYQDTEETGLLVGIPDVSVMIGTATDSVPEGAIAVAEPIASAEPQRVMLPMPITVNERYLEIREIASDAVVTAIELLSPKNKRAGEGRRSYEAKRNSILGSLTHLVEIDLLRAGVAMPMAPVRSLAHYYVLVSRSPQRPEGDLFTWTVRDRLPLIPIPLITGEPDLRIDLQAVFEGVYRRSRYSTRIGYQQPVPPPKLSNLDQVWAEERVAVWREKFGSS